MSLVGKYYTVAGYDFSAYEDIAVPEEWANDERNEKYKCYQIAGNIQLFSDPSCGNHLVWGYIIADGDEYDYDFQRVNVEELNKIKQRVDWELYASGLNFHKIPDDAFEFKIMSFVEYR